MVYIVNCSQLCEVIIGTALSCIEFFFFRGNLSPTVLSGMFVSEAGTSHAQGGQACDAELLYLYYVHATHVSLSHRSQAGLACSSSAHICCRRRMLSHWFAGGFVLSTCPISYLTRSLLLSWQQEKTMSIGSRQFLRVKLTRNLLFSLLLSLCYGYRSCVAFFFPCPRHSQRCCFVSERQVFRRPTGSSHCWQERTEKRAAYTGINKNLVKATLSLSRQG